MLQVTVPGYEYFDEKRGEFGQVKTTTLQLEHSLVSLAKWESKWNKPFLGKEDKTREQCIDYVRCMTITQHVDPLVYLGLTDEIIAAINQYIEAPMTATWFNEKDTKKFNQKTITAEVIYYWMISLNIPFECQKWHLNRLITLVRVCNAKNAPKKKPTMRERLENMEQRRAINEARKQKLHTTG